MVPFPDGLIRPAEMLAILLELSLECPHLFNLFLHLWNLEDVNACGVKCRWKLLLLRQEPAQHSRGGFTRPVKRGV